jgi:hypothetical protein
VKLGRELLPDQLGSELLPATAPLNAPFWGRPVVFLFGIVFERPRRPTDQEQTENDPNNRKTVGFFSQSKQFQDQKIQRAIVINWVVIN